MKRFHQSEVVYFGSFAPGKWFRKCMWHSIWQLPTVDILWLSIYQSFWHILQLCIWQSFSQFPAHLVWNVCVASIITSNPASILTFFLAYSLWHPFWNSIWHSFKHVNHTLFAFDCPAFQLGFILYFLQQQNMVSSLAFSRIFFYILSGIRLESAIPATVNANRRRLSSLSVSYCFCLQSNVE